jgi:type IV secretory pathway TraG/TraD family ATPase VirD4
MWGILHLMDCIINVIVQNYIFKIYSSSLSIFCAILLGRNIINHSFVSIKRFNFWLDVAWDIPSLLRILKVGQKFRVSSEIANVLVIERLTLLLRLKERRSIFGRERYIGWVDHLNVFPTY